MILFTFQYRLKTLKLLRVKPSHLDHFLRLNTYMAHFGSQNRLVTRDVTEPFRR